MKRVCRRCSKITKQKMYRVRTEESGVVLLDIRVCVSCARIAKSLGLPVMKLEPAKKAAQTKAADAITERQRQTVQARASTR